MYHSRPNWNETGFNALQVPSVPNRTSLSSGSWRHLSSLFFNWYFLIKSCFGSFVCFGFIRESHVTSGITSVVVILCWWKVFSFHEANKVIIITPEWQQNGRTNNLKDSQVRRCVLSKQRYIDHDEPQTHKNVILYVICLHFQTCKHHIKHQLSVRIWIQGFQMTAAKCEMSLHDDTHLVTLLLSFSSSKCSAPFLPLS